MSEYSFDLDAGDLSLDFANTSNWHASEHPEESLNDYFDLLAWGLAADVISQESVEQLSRMAHDQPQLADLAYQRAINTREAIYRIFTNHYAGEPVAEKDLTNLNALVRDAAGHRQLVPNNDHYQWQLKPDGVDSTLILWAVAIAAVELLTSEKVGLVRECEDDRGCGYLFIDMSKNHSRRWCSMESCGNRAKARRHYSRSKAEKE